MRHEIRSGSYFLSDLLRLGHSLSEQQLNTFRTNLEDLLTRHYLHHWFPERPTRGSGFRCLRINHKMDPLIAQAASSCGITDASQLRSMFPSELTLWIDPREVSYRIGENGSICVIYDGLSKSASCTTNITSNSTVSPQQHSNNNNNNNNKVIGGGGSPNKNSNLSSSPPSNHHQHHHYHHQQHNNHHNYHQSPTNVVPVNGVGSVGGSHPNVFDRYATCKESVRGMDHLMIDNRHMNMEQFAPYVSS